MVDVHRRHRSVEIQQSLLIYGKLISVAKVLICDVQVACTLRCLG